MNSLFINILLQNEINIINQHSNIILEPISNMFNNRIVYKDDYINFDDDIQQFYYDWIESDNNINI